MILNVKFLPAVGRMLVATSMVLVACSSPKPASKTPPKTAAKSAAKAKEKSLKKTLAEVGLDAAALDRKAKPCDDFYQYACGSWVANTEIPADRGRWSRSFSEIHKRNEALLHKILEDARTDKEKADPLIARLGSYYAACMDEASIEKLGTKPIKAQLKKIKRIKRIKDIAALTFELHRIKIFPLFDISAEQDFKDATKMNAILDQAGLGLPDRDYYFRDDDRSKKIRTFYLGHIERMLKLAGFSGRAAKKAAKDVIRIETALAEVSKTRVERRDPKTMYNRISREEIKKSAANFPWDDYFKALGFPQIADISMTAPKFFAGLNDLLKKEKPKAWRSYFAWQLVHHTAKMLPKKFVDENFALRQALTGQKEQRPRWKRCVQSTDGAMGEALAQPYVKLRFAGKSKTATEEMVHEISEAFAVELKKVTWMDPVTKKSAIEKRDAMAFLIGYPDKWKTYRFEVKRDSYRANVLAATAEALHRQLSKIGKPVNPNDWEMSPPTVNAYYHPLKNHMVFPAGILQPPFYSSDAEISVNMGAMGFVVGHELTHGFDDQGSQFDAKGNMRKWWQDGVREKFTAKAQCVEKQFSAYEAVPGVKVNGKLTLGENIADLAGIKLAFKAYRAMRKKRKQTVVAEGFDEDQLFFLSVGQTWCSKYREKLARLQAQTDPHSPPKYRVNGPLSNLKEFADAFQCKAGRPMVAKDACEVW